MMTDPLRVRVAKRVHAIAANAIRDLYKDDPEMAASVSDWESDIQSGETMAIHFALADEILLLLQTLGAIENQPYVLDRDGTLYQGRANLCHAARARWCEEETNGKA